MCIVTEMASVRDEEQSEESRSSLSIPSSMGNLTGGEGNMKYTHSLDRLKIC